MKLVIFSCLISYLSPFGFSRVDLRLPYDYYAVEQDMTLDLADYSAVLIDANGGEKAIRNSDFKLNKRLTKVHWLQLKQLIHDNGLYYDAETIQLIYDINPNVNSLTEIRDDWIYIPIVKHHELVALGLLMKLTLNVELKEAINSEYEDVASIISEMDMTNAPERFRTSVSSSVEWFKLARNVINYRAKPIDYETLIEIHGNLLVMKSIVKSYEIDRSVDLFSGNSLKLISKMLSTERSSVIESEMSVSVPNRLPSKEIVVIVKKVDSDVDVHDLRVWYTGEVFYLYKMKDHFFSFTNLTSPYKKVLKLNSTYRIWASDPRDMSEGLTRLTNAYKVNVTNDTDTITLVLNER